MREGGADAHTERAKMSVSVFGYRGYADANDLFKVNRSISRQSIVICLKMNRIVCELNPNYTFKIDWDKYVCLRAFVRSVVCVCYFFFRSLFPHLLCSVVAVSDEIASAFLSDESWFLLLFWCFFVRACETTATQQYMYMHTHARTHAYIYASQHHCDCMLFSSTQNVCRVFHFYQIRNLFKIKEMNTTSTQTYFATHMKYASYDSWTEKGIAINGPHSFAANFAINSHLFSFGFVFQFSNGIYSIADAHKILRGKGGSVMDLHEISIRYSFDGNYLLPPLFCHFLQQWNPISRTQSMHLQLLSRLISNWSNHRCAHIHSFMHRFVRFAQRRELFAKWTH